MLSLGHFKFLEKLKFKCKEFQRNLIITSEEHTSKTCGNCGIVNYNLGSKHLFKCSSCEVKIDRDINGARNILIKYLTGLDTRPFSIIAFVNRKVANSRHKTCLVVRTDPVFNPIPNVVG